MNIFSDMQAIKLEDLKIPCYSEGPVPRVNAHFHTPYSFSSFNDIEEVFLLAERDHVDILGINDFITTDGYEEFERLAIRYRRFPLFNIEFMGLIPDAKKKGIRINDPNNPGRIYLCGKGLVTPEKLNAENKKELKKVYDESLHHVRDMVKKLNKILSWYRAPFVLDFETIREKYTKGLVRERHVVKALRTELKNNFTDDASLHKFLVKIYKGGDQTASLSDPVALDNELRSRLLKKGGPAYVEESPAAFLPVEMINRIILNAGGIPCYPVLLDDESGNFTEFEKDYTALYRQLQDYKIFSVELIPRRNNIWFLKEFVEFFTQRQFIVTFGTEHNTPGLDPLSISCRGDVPLTDELNSINYESACILAAHQYLVSRNEEGYIKKSGVPHFDKIEMFKSLGDTVIRNFIKPGK